MNSQIVVAVALLAGLVLPGHPAETEPVRALPNENRIPAGAVEHDTLVLNLVVQSAEWYPEAGNGPHITIEAFGEAGKAPSIPAPLIRTPTRRPIRAMIRNALTDSTIHVLGLATQPVSDTDTLHIAPGDSAQVVFSAGAPGTYVYRAVIGNNPDGRPSERETAVGAFVVDPAGGSPPDRVFVINVIAYGEAPSLRQAIGFNGRSWPYTERVPMTVGDTARWRIVNGTTRGHPMHLHGFYFRLDAAGDGRSSLTIPTDRRRLAVTEQVQAWGTRTLTWSPDRPGNWLFHCHLTFHVTPEARLGYQPSHDEDSHAADPAQHMAGLVLGIPVRPREGESYRRTGDARRLDLYFHQGGPRGNMPKTFSYVLQRGATAPADDSLEIPGSTIVVTRGTASDVVVHNRGSEATAIHWHGLELESWSDGVAGWSGSATALAPPVLPGDSFVARLSLPRAGTFIYHTHLNDVAQIIGGAAGALVVVEPGETLDPERDHVYVVQWEGRLAPGLVPLVLVNGDSTSGPSRSLARGSVHRLRLVNIGAAGLVRFDLRADTALAQWRWRAKDGADLPAALQVIQPARQAISVGETYDFEFLADRPGDYELTVTPLAPPGITGRPRIWRQRLLVR